jgi:hypothetical protein
MTSWDATFVMRKAEDRSTEPERTGDYASLRAQGQNHRKRDLNEELWKTVPPSHLTAATWKVIILNNGLFAKRATNYLDSRIGKMDTAKQCITK